MSGNSHHFGSFHFTSVQATSVSEPFVPRRFLRNNHAQTLAGNFLPRESRLPPAEERLFQVEDDVQVLCHCHWQPERTGRMTVIILHGLEGSSLSQYVIGTGSKAWEAGMNVVRMNMRNCGGTEQLAPTLYHSGLSGDIGAVARTLIEQDCLQHLALVGYSMGGNLVLKLAGEWGIAAPTQLRAVAAVSPSTDLGACADAIHEWPPCFRRYLAVYKHIYRLLFVEVVESPDPHPRNPVIARCGITCSICCARRTRISR